MLKGGAQSPQSLWSGKLNKYRSLLSRNDVKRAATDGIQQLLKPLYVLTDS